MDAFKFQASPTWAFCSKLPEMLFGFFHYRDLFRKGVAHLLRAATHDVVLLEDMRAATITVVVLPRTEFPICTKGEGKKKSLP